jgi:hypothetical protein
VRERERPLEQRVSVLDRAPTESDVVPETVLTAPMRQEVDVASIRLALTFDDRRIYVGLGTRPESLFLGVDGPNGGGASVGPRATLVTHGARVQGGEGMTIGVVADPVTAVRVGDVEAVLANNVFVAEASLSGGIVVTSPAGERTVPRPPQPDPRRSTTRRLQGPFQPLA